ncbi:hypothetical protein CLI78_10720 [Porphyromonas gingivalis]|nr:hypothetical protein CLI78_10720 [Porphyromonas gingivalis]
MARRSKLFKCLPIMDTGCIPPNCQLFSVHVRDCCRGFSSNSFAAEQILSVFGKGQTSGIWAPSK